MSNITLSWPNRIDEAVLTCDVGFVPTLPLSNAQTPIYPQVARTNGGMSIAITATYGRQRPIGAIAIANHNLSPTAQWRIRQYYGINLTSLKYDSGLLSVWPSQPSLDMEWEDDGFWFGVPDLEFALSFVPVATHFAPASELTGSLVIEVIDEGNADGYIEFGRLFTGLWWEPLLNPQFGNAPISYEDQTERSEANDGTDYFYEKKKRRLVNIGLENITEQQALQDVFGMQRLQGISGEILFSHDRDASLHSFQRTFIGRLTQLDPLSEVDFGKYSVQLNIREVV